MALRRRRSLRCAGGACPLASGAGGVQILNRPRQKSRPFGQGTAKRDSTLTRWLMPARSLVLAVMLGVMTAGLDMMMFGMAGMTVGAVSVVRRLLVIAGLMMLGGFTMVLGCVLVMFGSLVMVLDACVVAHVFSPGWPI